MSISRPFHVLLLPVAEQVPPRRETRVGQVTLQVLDVPIGHGQFARWQVTFDEAIQRLGQLPRLFIEPDGSFVWVGMVEDQRWQLDGNLVDGGDRLWYVELKGTSPRAARDQLLSAIGDGAPRGWYQLVSAGVTLAEDEFHRYVMEENV